MLNICRENILVILEAVKYTTKSVQDNRVILSNSFGTLTSNHNTHLQPILHEMSIVTITYFNQTYLFYIDFRTKNISGRTLQPTNLLKILRPSP